MDEYTPKYLPGFEPENIKPLVDSFFNVINKTFPDKVVVRNEWNHQWDNAASMLCKKLGYANGKDFLESYGFSIVDDRKSVITQSNTNSYNTEYDSTNSASSLKNNRNGKNILWLILFCVIILSLFIIVSPKCTHCNLPCFRELIPDTGLYYHYICQKIVDKKDDGVKPSTLSPVEQARIEVVNKFRSESDVLGTSKFIEDTYKKYPSDDVISNIYYYCIAKEEYDMYLKFSNNEDYLTMAKEFAAKIDPYYKGDFSEEMHSFVKKLLPSDNYGQVHTTAVTQEQKYNSLSNSEKKAIGDYIQSRYDYYDKKAGGYAGDKYSDTIMQEAADKYGLSVSQVNIIWMNYYSY